ncbi:MAG: SycD/LcrH family type III secretion system chaperone [Deltaproteobacteria bacterium]|jgi:type III secretion system low calcium response chaperone LcrH/SycD|nr:SycD/LcrH family type III secretion system chaperone [Deltaproteobacteria bacterium]
MNQDTISDQGIDLSNISEEDLQTVMECVAKGVTPAEVAGVGQDRLEALYALGHRLYTTGEYQDAETVFKSLCIYDYHDDRFWMGLGATFQAQKNYQRAIDVYSMAGMTTGLNDPTPFYYAALCFLKLGDKQSADVSLSAIKAIGQSDNSKHADIKAKAASLRSLLQDQLISQNTSTSEAIQ